MSIAIVMSIATAIAALWRCQVDFRPFNLTRAALYAGNL